MYCMYMCVYIYIYIYVYTHIHVCIVDISTHAPALFSARRVRRHEGEEDQDAYYTSIRYYVMLLHIIIYNGIL